MSRGLFETILVLRNKEQENRLRKMLVVIVSQLMIVPMEKSERKELFYKYVILRELVDTGIVGKINTGVELNETHGKLFLWTSFNDAWHSIKRLL